MAAAMNVGVDTGDNADAVTSVWCMVNTFSECSWEPALIQSRVIYLETCIQALDKLSGETIVDPRAINFAKEDPGFALRIPNDILPISSRAGDEQRPL
jgi:hypothetical protein